MVDRARRSSRLRGVPEDDNPPAAEEAFLRLTFDGGRFAEHRLAVQALTEMATLERLLAVVAKRLYIEDHPGRKRVPKNFHRSGQLYLSEVEHNCSTGVLARQDAGTLKHAEDSEYFDRARDEVVRLLAAAGSGGSVGAVADDEEFQLLLALGARLEKNERLVFGGLQAPTAVVNSATRARLARARGQAMVIEQELSGEVDRFDEPGKKAWLRSEVGLLEFKFGPADREKIVTAIDLRPAAQLLVTGKAIEQATGGWRMVERPAIDVIGVDRYDDVLAIRDRIRTLGELAPGWLEGDGHVPSMDLLAFVQGVLSRLVVQDDLVPRPKIYPTPDGGLQAEWTDPVPVELWFSPEGSLLRLEVGDEAAEHLDAEMPATDVDELDAAVLVKWFAALRAATRA